MLIKPLQPKRQPKKVTLIVRARAKPAEIAASKAERRSLKPVLKVQGIEKPASLVGKVRGERRASC